MPQRDARDSRAERPSQPVRLRDGATIDRETVRVTADIASKRNAYPTNFGYGSGTSDMQSYLRVEAWVRNGAYTKRVWLDVHVFDREGALLHSETRTMGYARADDTGDLFSFDDVLYQGSRVTAGVADARPDARAVQYRIYCEQTDEVFTDGLAHWRDLRMDASSS